jgi:predicted protein tyrosine phosphatase
MTEILVMSRRQIETYEFGNVGKVAIISITDPLESLVNIRSSDNILDVLSLKFYDVDKEAGGYKPMNEDDAKKIVSFVSKWWRKVDYIVVQCHAGISRSAGVDAGLAKWYFSDDEEYFQRYRPNMNCYRLVIDEFRHKVFCGE